MTTPHPLFEPLDTDLADLQLELRRVRDRLKTVPANSILAAEAWIDYRALSRRLEQRGN